MPSLISESRVGADPRVAIRERAAAEGFDAVGFAAARLPRETAQGLKDYLAQGHHGAMAWMEMTAERRGDPAKLWEAAKSVIALGVTYTPQDDPLVALKDKTRGAISVYAQGEDYHEILKKKLRRLAEWLVKTQGGEAKIFVDTAPVMEKPLAQAAGFGWQGKHTNLVSRRHGSWLFLGSIFTTLTLEPDEAERDHCGSCQSCLDICPTKAFPAPYRLDARRCISYLTIEHKDHIAAEFRAAIGNRIYGCDDCLAVCPWNKFAQAGRELAFAPRAELRGPRLADLAALDDAAFRDVFRGSPVKRIGRHRFVRNVLIAIGNSGDPSLAPAAEAHIRDASPLVRAMAVWALKRLTRGEEFVQLAQHYAAMESDPVVAQEWASSAQTAVTCPG